MLTHGFRALRARSSSVQMLASDHVDSLQITLKTQRISVDGSSRDLDPLQARQIGYPMRLYGLNGGWVQVHDF